MDALNRINLATGFNVSGVSNDAYNDMHSEAQKGRNTQAHKEYDAVSTTPTVEKEQILKLLEACMACTDLDQVDIPVGEKMERVLHLESLKQTGEDIALFDACIKALFDSRTAQDTTFALEVEGLKAIYIKQRDHILDEVFKEELHLTRSTEGKLALSIVSCLEKLTARAGLSSTTEAVLLKYPRVTEKIDWHVSEGEMYYFFEAATNQYTTVVTRLKKAGIEQISDIQFVWSPITGETGSIRLKCDCQALEKVKQGLEALTESYYNACFLDLSNQPSLTDTLFRSILEKNSNVASLNLEGCCLLTDEAMQLLAGKGLNLKELNLNGCVGITEAGIKTVLAKTKVEKLTLNNHPLSTQLEAFKKLYTEGGQEATLGEFYCNLSTFRGHEESVKALSLLRDGRLVSASEDKTLKVWDRNGSCLSTLQGHSEWVYSCLQLKDGRLASSSIDGTIKIWDLDKSECLMTLEEPGGPVYSCIQLKNGQLASGSLDDTIKVWNIEEENCCESILEGHTGPVHACTQLKDGRLASGSEDGSIKIWDIGGAECLMTLKEHAGKVDCCIELMDGRLVSSSQDNTLKIWNVDTGECLATLEGHEGPVNTCIQLQDGRLVSGSEDNTLKIWNVDTGVCLVTLEGHEGPVNTCTDLGKGYLASASDDRTIKLWFVGKASN